MSGLRSSARFPPLKYPALPSEEGRQTLMLSLGTSINDEGRNLWAFSCPGELPIAAWGSLPCLACSQALLGAHLHADIPGAAPCSSCAQAALWVASLPGSRGSWGFQLPFPHRRCVCGAPVEARRGRMGSAPRAGWGVCAALGSTWLLSNFNTGTVITLLCLSLSLFVLSQLRGGSLRGGTRWLQSSWIPSAQNGFVRGDGSVSSYLVLLAWNLGQFCICTPVCPRSVL